MNQEQNTYAPYPHGAAQIHLDLLGANQVLNVNDVLRRLKELGNKQGERLSLLMRQQGLTSESLAERIRFQFPHDDAYWYPAHTLDRVLRGVAYLDAEQQVVVELVLGEPILVVPPPPSVFDVVREAHSKLVAGYQAERRAKLPDLTTQAGILAALADGQIRQEHELPPVTIFDNNPDNDPNLAKYVIGEHTFWAKPNLSLDEIAAATELFESREKSPVETGLPIEGAREMVGEETPDSSELIPLSAVTQMVEPAERPVEDVTEGSISEWTQQKPD